MAVKIWPTMWSWNEQTTAACGTLRFLCIFDLVHVLNILPFTTHNNKITICVFSWSSHACVSQAHSCSAVYSDSLVKHSCLGCMYSVQCGFRCKDGNSTVRHKIFLQQCTIMFCFSFFFKGEDESIKWVLEWMCMVVQWLARLPHSRKVLCSTPPGALLCRPFCVEFACFLRAFVGLLWVLQLSLTDQRCAIWLSGNSKLLIGMNTVSPVIDWWPGCTSSLAQRSPITLHFTHRSSQWNWGKKVALPTVTINISKT